MTRNLRGGRAVGLGLVLIVLTGCTSQSVKLTRCNDRIALANKKLAMATWDFRETIYPLSKDTPPDSDTVKSAYENMKSTLAEIRKEHDKAKDDLPDAASAKELYEVYGDFLDGQEQLIEREFAAMVAWAENPKLKPVEKWAKIQAEIFKVQERERQDMQKLQKAQEKFTTEANMKVVLTR